LHGSAVDGIRACNGDAGKKRQYSVDNSLFKTCNTTERINGYVNGTGCGSAAGKTLYGLVDIIEGTCGEGGKLGAIEEVADYGAGERYIRAQQGFKSIFYISLQLAA